MLKDILRRGYFPRELPSPFNTNPYATLFSKPNPPLPFSYGVKGPKYLSRCFPYNLARRGTLRRALSIPNPINFFHIAAIVSSYWKDLDAHYSKTDQSLSRPVMSSRGRAFEWQRGFKLLPQAKLKIRNGARFIVRTDISNFFFLSVHAQHFMGLAH
jgi:hypothetical protein